MTIKDKIIETFDNHKVDYSTSRRRDILKLKKKLIDALEVNDDGK